jgi:hypothetical protein
VSTRARSTATFFVLLAILAAAAALNSVLPQGTLSATPLPPARLPGWQLALAGAGITLVLYGLLGGGGLLLWRRLGFPEIWEEGVTSRQRFLAPALVGGALGLALIALDLLFGRVNGVGRLPHPPFPTSLVASLSAGIGEEMLFRLFFISFWTWLVGRVILRGRGLAAVYWIVAAFSALAFAASHLPTLMIILGVKDPSAFSPVLLLQVLLLNGLISFFAAYSFRKGGFLSAVGIHFWADVVWHVLWGLV